MQPKKKNYVFKMFKIDENFYAFIILYFNFFIIDFVKPIFRSGILSTKDLKIGTVLDGVVRNVTTFGAFVDIGVGKNGLLHISKFQGRTFGPGDKVMCKINSLENERIGLMLDQ